MFYDGCKENVCSVRILKKLCQYVDFWCLNRPRKTNQLDMVRSQSVTFLRKACDIVWRWGNPTLTSLWKVGGGGDGEGRGLAWV